MAQLSASRPGTAPAAPISPPTVRPVMLLTFDVPFDRTAVSFAVETAAETGAELYLCDAVPIAMANPAAQAARSLAEHETRRDLDAVARWAREFGVRTTQLIFHNPRPVRAALDVTRDQRVGLLVFGADRTRMGRWNFRRAARKLRKAAPCLVWTNE
jgi:nucleotide-binding universal stress UspA family protein